MTKPQFDIIQLSRHNDDTPYACMVVGHVQVEALLAQCNEGWSDDPWQAENTRYEYAVPRKTRYNLNVKPGTANAIPVTVVYWEEPLPHINAG